MIRSSSGDELYWSEFVSFRKKSLREGVEIISRPSGNPLYRPQFVFDEGLNNVRCLISCYSAGEGVGGLECYLVGLIENWELSEFLSREVCREYNRTSCRDWDFSFKNLNHYNWCFWLIGLALALEIPDYQWQRLLRLIGGEGEDLLLDRVIASRQPGRKVGRRLLHPKPYARLLKAVIAPKEDQAHLLRDFVDHWYADLRRPPPKNRRAPTIEPFWHSYGDPERHPFESGSFFGCWCIEAVAAVKAFGLDDRLCLGHPHYPGDLLRPDGPSTHPIRTDTKPTLYRRWKAFLRKIRARAK